MHECSSGCLCFGQKLLLHLQLKVLVMLIFLLHVKHLVLFTFFLLTVKVFATNFGLPDCLPFEPLLDLEADLNGSKGELVHFPSKV